MYYYLIEKDLVVYQTHAIGGKWTGLHTYDELDRERDILKIRRLNKRFEVKQWTGGITGKWIDANIQVVQYKKKLPFYLWLIDEEGWDRLDKDQSFILDCIRHREIPDKLWWDTEELWKEVLVEYGNFNGWMLDLIPELWDRYEQHKKEV